LTATVRDLEEEKWEFLDEEFLASSIRGAFGHAKIYRGKTSEERRKFAGELRKLLRKCARAYKNEVPEEAHNENIRKLADKLSRDFKDAMKDKRFRIGIAQKALNLYLKYLWCMGRIRTPPHCPFDSEVLRKAKVGESWTRLDDMDGYKLWVAKARSVAGDTNLKLSEWELRLWNQRIRRSHPDLSPATDGENRSFSESPHSNQLKKSETWAS
jgi:hypothetical protein